MDKQLPETTNLYVDIMNSKRQVIAYGRLGYVVQIRFCR